MEYQVLRKLSRISITGEINDNTPLIVLIEISDAHGIKYDIKDLEKPNFGHFLIKKIKEIEPCIIYEKIENEKEWKYVARFINKNAEWPIRKLTDAYNFLIKFMNKEDPLIMTPINFEYGLQTPLNPFSLNACVLYKICIYYGLNTHLHTTLEQMAYAVRMLRENTDSLIRRTEFFIKRDAKKLDLINILMFSNYEIEDNECNLKNDEDMDFNIIPKIQPSYEILKLLHRSLYDVKTLQQKIDPGTKAGAISLAAINYKIDITRAEDPISEYKILKIDGRYDYIPSDKWMKYWYNKNPGLFDMTLSFNPVFSQDFYNKNNIVNMLKAEGYKNNEILNDFYELLQLTYVSKTFYLGEMPNMNSNKTPISLDDISEIPYGELLCYGQMEFKMQPISISELFDLFSSNQNFDNPFELNSIFTFGNISKLKSILINNNGPNINIPLSCDTLKKKNDLLILINEIENMMKNDIQSRELIKIYNNSSEKTRISIKNTLKQILYIGMYMRGWSGKGEYPIVRSIVPLEKEIYIATKVTTSISEYEKKIKILDNIGQIINNLPLVNYKDGQYFKSIDIKDGFTIGERIEIVKQGENTNNISSCIRLSSNWICSSAHKYISLFSPSPFDIFKLRHIA